MINELRGMSTSCLLHSLLLLLLAPQLSLASRASTANLLQVKDNLYLYNTNGALQTPPISLRPFPFVSSVSPYCSNTLFSTQ